MNRWKNAGMWVSLVALVPLVLEFFGVKVLPEQLAAGEEAVKAVIALLVAMGILNNPTTDSKGFMDDKPREEEI